MTTVSELVKEGKKAASDNDYSTAVDKYTQAIGKSRDKRDNQTIYGNRSWIYSRQSNYKKGLVDANKTIEINSSYYLGWACKALALFGLGHISAAREALEQTLKFNPGTRRARSRIDTVQEAIDSGGNGEFLNDIHIAKETTKRKGEEEQEVGERPAKKVKREGPDATTSIDTTHAPEPEIDVVFKFILEQSGALCSFPMAECNTSAALFTKFRTFFQLLNKDTVVSVLSCRLGSQDDLKTTGTTCLRAVRDSLRCFSRM